MKEKGLALFNQLRELWGSFSTAKRVSLIVVTMAVVVGVLTFSFYSSRVSYAYLFTDLSPEDAASITSKLKELKVPYRVGAGGTAIEVPDEHVHEIRLDLAGQGLPRGGGIGFEIFDKSHLGATEFEQRINLRRALEGELARTIGNISAVQSARVHLVMPEHSVFAIAKQEASASVVLRLRPGRPFGKGEVGSVVHLVASAVPGLSADRVSIISADGTMLHRPRSEASGVLAASDGEADHERELASGLEEQARALLERVVGPGHADVRIALRLDTASHERTEEHFEPSKTALRSEQRSDERTAPEGATVAGVPGAASNLPDATSDPLGGGTASGALRTSWTRNWEVDRVTEKTSTPAGRVSRLTVAALVDGTYNGAHDFVPRDPAELERLALLVKQAVGFNAERGDVVQIECARFAGADAPEEPKIENEKTKRLITYGGAGLALLVLLLAVVILVRRGKRVTKDLKLGAPDRTLALDATRVAPALPAMPPPDAAELRAQALEIATKDPATAAVILRGWLNAPSATPQAR
ncbi:MAG TPA: flagellar basal-body MS-ring/collar protein FliF [Polyangiaceae bacterium]|nr:flagellar basal-body MS-ring/collar protein FliF [Polyangiaceae bacterium]